MAAAWRLSAFPSVRPYGLPWVSGVYAVEHIGSGELYIGETFSLCDRWSGHSYYARGAFKSAPTAARFYLGRDPSEFFFYVLRAMPGSSASERFFVERQMAMFAYWLGFHVVNTGCGKNGKSLGRM
jgi:hypothetical protein